MRDYERERGSGIIGCLLTGFIVGAIVRWLGVWKSILVCLVLYYVYKHWDAVDVWMHSSDYLLDM